MSNINYSNPKKREAFTGRNVFARYSQLSSTRVNNILSKHPSYVLHREVKRPRVYNPFMLYSKRELLQADLIDLAAFSSANNGFKYILIVCDTFTRYCWAKALRNKTTDLVLKQFMNIYKVTG